MANVVVQCIQLQKNELYRINPKLRLSSHRSQDFVGNEEIENGENFSHALPSRLEYVQDRGTQTDFRESECQTSPWEPPYKIVSGHNPEVLNLTWKHGSSIGMHDIEIINRMRIRRAWEKILPPMDTEANIKLRTNIVAALEADEWAYRESEIEFIMKIRMDLAEKVMKTRNDEWNKKKKNRFMRLGSSLEEKRDKEIKKIRHKFGRELRKLTMKHRIGNRYKHHDIINKHEDRVSEFFSSQMQYRQKFYKQGHFEEKKMKELCVRETKWNNEKLEELYEELKKIRLNVQTSGSICNVEQKSKPIVLPSTPNVRDDNLISNIEDESATLIQNAIRGRAIQYMMFEGREKCRDLIKELQTVYAIHDEDKEKIEKRKAEILSKQQEEQLKRQQECRLNEILSSLEGMTVSGMMDFLSKELIRLEDERKAHAFALLAERERSKREAAEIGRRQDEFQRRKELDQVFRQIVKLNQNTVEAYLEDIVKEGIDWVSEKEAKEYVLALADKIDSVSKYAAENAAEIDEEEMVSDMVYNFVLPEVEREIMRKKIKVKEHEYLNTAHDELLNFSLTNESEHQKEVEILDINLPTTSTQLSFSESKIIQEDYRNIIDTIIDKIMSFVIPNENENTIREILNDVVVEIVQDFQDKLIHETSYSSSSSWSDLYLNHGQ